MSAVPQPSPADLARNLARNGAVWLLVATLAWAPFPLGGAIAWAAGLQEMLITACFILWVLGEQDGVLSGNRIVAVPLALAVLAIGWAVVQITPGLPQNWLHPVWIMASDTFGGPVAGTISLNPWRTEAEIVKLASYVMAAWLAFRMARRVDTAKLLLNAVIAIGTVYALYAFILEFARMQQTDVFYALPNRNRLISGSFMLHNSFATFMGMAAIGAVAKLFASGSELIAADRGARRLAETVLSYCFGRGAALLVASILALAGVIGSASRAGFAATMCGLATIALVSLLVVRGRTPRLWAAAGALAAVVPLLVLVTLNGDTLDSRLGQLLASGDADAIRLSLWESARRMIFDAPWLGLGLGTFEDAYPLYAAKVYPYVMDKAHCDYLEFAAGLGLPAAVAWWGALLWLATVCLRGVRERRRHRVYCIVALGASALVAVHSSVDFSLQLPAVALLYAILMGIGLAQSQSSRTRRSH